jgi:predicted nucleic acid-binding protein
MALAWVFDDERDAQAMSALDRVAEFGAVVPRLWWWEVANVILSAVRRKRIKREDADEILEELGALPIYLDTGSAPGFGAETALARRFNLSVYDAAYLELGLRTGLELLTNDAHLDRAARELGLNP